MRLVEDVEDDLKRFGVPTWRRRAQNREVMCCYGYQGLSWTVVPGIMMLLQIPWIF